MISCNDKFIRLDCFECGMVSRIPWSEVDTSVGEKLCGCYGEFKCPECGAVHGVYTRYPIERMMERRTKGTYAAV